jgi:hypothetical protein
VIEILEECAEKSIGIMKGADMTEYDYPKIDDEEYPYSTMMGLLIIRAIIERDDVAYFTDATIRETADYSQIPIEHCRNYLKLALNYIDKLAKSVKRRKTLDNNREESQ